MNMAISATAPKTDKFLDYVKSTLNDSGRIVIPAKIRREMGLNPGDTLLLRVEEGRLVAESQQARIRRVQESLRGRISAERVLSDELVAERREEARHETEEWLG